MIPGLCRFTLASHFSSQAPLHLFSLLLNPQVFIEPTLGTIWVLETNGIWQLIYLFDDREKQKSKNTNVLEKEMFLNDDAKGKTIVLMVRLKYCSQFFTSPDIVMVSSSIPFGFRLYWVTYFDQYRWAKVTWGYCQAQDLRSISTCHPAPLPCWWKDCATVDEDMKFMLANFKCVSVSPVYNIKLKSLGTLVKREAHTEWCSGITSGSMLRDHPMVDAWGNEWGQELNQLCVR